MKLISIPLKPEEWNRIMDSLDLQGYDESEELAKKIKVFLDAEKKVKK